MTRDETEERITLQLVDFTNRFHDVGKKADAARAVVACGNGNVALAYRPNTGVGKRLLYGAVLLIGTVLGTNSYFEAQELKNRNANLERHTVLLSELAQKRLEVIKEYIPEALDSRVQLQTTPEYDDISKTLDLFVHDQINRKLAQREFVSGGPWENHVDSFYRHLYGQRKCRVLYEMVRQRMVQGIRPGQNERVEDVIAEWNKHPEWNFRYALERGRE